MTLPYQARLLASITDKKAQTALVALLKMHGKESFVKEAAIAGIQKNASIFQMISDLDEDGSGQIEFKEWVHLMTHRVNNQSSREAINKVFPLYDDEKTGYLSVKNLRRVAQELGENISEEELQEMIDRADTDRDGLVSADEFYTILTRPMKE